MEPFDFAQDKLREASSLLAVILFILMLVLPSSPSIPYKPLVAAWWNECPINVGYCPINVGYETVS